MWTNWKATLKIIFFLWHTDRVAAQCQISVNHKQNLFCPKSELSESKQCAPAGLAVSASAVHIFPFSEKTDALRLPSMLNLTRPLNQQRAANTDCYQSKHSKIIKTASYKHNILNFVFRTCQNTKLGILKCRGGTFSSVNILIDKNILVTITHVNTSLRILNLCEILVWIMHTCWNANCVHSSYALQETCALLIFIRGTYSQYGFHVNKKKMQWYILCAC